MDEQANLQTVDVEVQTPQLPDSWLWFIFFGWLIHL